jgi:hypothetical protein
LNFVGSFNYVPDPIEYNEGSIYKNINEGVAYIRKGLLWEELVRDGKPGRDAARVGGSGVGVAEVKEIVGNLGIYSTISDLNSIDTSNLKVGTTAQVNSIVYTWNGTSIGWTTKPNINSVGNRWVWDGDSITAGFNGVQTMAAILNGKMVIAGNVAVPGQNINQMLSRIQATLAYKPNGIWLMAGTNDAGQGRTQAQFSQDLISYINIVQGAGVQLILSLIPPRSDSYNLAVQGINNCIRRIAGIYGIPLCDPWENFRANDGTWIAGSSGDNVHPYPFVLVQAANSANTQLSGYLNSMPSIYPCLAQPDGGLRTNNLFLTDTNADGLADGINAASGATQTLSASTLPKLGKKQTFSWSSYAGDSTALIFGGTISPGDRILFVSRFYFDPQGSTNTKIEIKLVGDFGAKTHGNIFGGGSANFQTAFSGIIAKEFVAVSGSTSFDISPSVQRVSGGVITASIAFEQTQMYNLTALGLT